MNNKRTLIDSFSIRLAKARRGIESRPLLRFLGGRGAATLFLGGVLSVGGFAETMNGVHFLVQKNLDAVRIVREQGDDAHVVAKVSDGFAANSLFKLSRVFPNRFVSHQISLFDDRWLPPGSDQQPVDVFHEEMARINSSIRRDFFSNAVPFGSLIHEKAEKYDIDPALVAAVVETESRFRSNARSQVGARGLMQLMPRTGRWLGADDLYDPEQNVDAGVKYLKYLSGRFDGNMKKTLAAYNAGEANVRRYDGVPPFRETQSYVRSVMQRYQHRNQQLKQYNVTHGAGADPVTETDATLTVR